MLGTDVIAACFGEDTLPSEMISRPPDFRQRFSTARKPCGCDE